MLLGVARKRLTSRTGIQDGYVGSRPGRPGVAIPCLQQASENSVRHVAASGSYTVHETSWGTPVYITSPLLPNEATVDLESAALQPL
jgi:hypothetical protein